MFCIRNKIMCGMEGESWGIREASRSQRKHRWGVSGFDNT
jgi:hypothetical protein